MQRITFPGLQETEQQHLTQQALKTSVGLGWRCADISLKLKDHKTIQSGSKHCLSRSLLVLHIHHTTIQQIAIEIHTHISQRPTLILRGDITSKDDKKYFSNFFHILHYQPSHNGIFSLHFYKEHFFLVSFVLCTPSCLNCAPSGLPKTTNSSIVELHIFS